MSNLWNRCALGVLFAMIPAAAWADLSGTVTVPAGSGLNLATGVVASGGGDIVYNGSQFVMQGTARAIDLGNLQATAFNSLINEAVIQANDPGFNGEPPNFAFTAIEGDVIAARTNGGLYAKILVQAISSSSTTLEYYTYGAASAPTGPAITAVQNNYSYLQEGLPNYGIAPGTLFIIVGTDLASATTPVLQTSAGSGIPTTLNGASISVTVGGVTTHPAMYYAIATQIAAVLPSNTPTGSGTITVSYGGQTSSAEPILVVPTALGLDTYYGSGTGLVTATDLSYNLIYYTNSAKPGQTIVLWGSGLGADLADSDTVATTTPHSINVPLTIYIGGIQATIQYQGSSGYPGLDQINVVIPPGVTTGCGVSIAAVSGTIVSNVVGIPVEPGGGQCSDPVITGTGPFPSASSYNTGSLQIVQATNSGKISSSAGADFVTISGLQGVAGSGMYSLGNCSASQSIIGGATTGTITQVGLDAGTITVTGPTGTQPVPSIASEPGAYDAQLPTGFVPTSGGSFVFTGTGGASVGPFTATVNYANPIVWTNASSISLVSRSQGVTVTWSGGDPNGYVLISGGSSSPETSSTPVLGAGFLCYAPVSAGTFTVPAPILLGMPIGPGSLSVENATTQIMFTAPGLAYGYAFAAFYTSITTPYQ